jgi:hypothetical protein
MPKEDPSDQTRMGADQKIRLRLKPPKTKRGLRTVDLDDATVAILLKEMERHRRIAAGIPDSVAVVELGLVRLPARALMFPALPEPAEDFDFTNSCNPAIAGVLRRVSQKMKEEADNHLALHCHLFKKSGSSNGPGDNRVTTGQNVRICSRGEDAKPLMLLVWKGGRVV